MSHTDGPGKGSEMGYKTGAENNPSCPSGGSVVLSHTRLVSLDFCPHLVSLASSLFGGVTGRINSNGPYRTRLLQQAAQGQRYNISGSRCHGQVKIYNFTEHTSRFRSKVYNAEQICN